MSHVFISYSHGDGDYARSLSRALESRGFAVWIDERIDYGDRWFNTITKAIRESAVFVVIMTPEAEASEWVEREVLLALRENKPIVPLLLRGQEFPILITKQFVDVRGGAMPSENFYAMISVSAPTATPQPSSGFLPMLAWCAVPAGSVIIENALYAVQPFSMAKYPVTNEQFQAFIDADYANSEWWDYSPLAIDWHKANPQPRESHFSGDLHPRESANWYEAVAFCRWLGASLDLPIRLPSEAEWQFAAQGDDERKFPWGDAADPTKCNTNEGRVDGTTLVDRYPQGARPFGVIDLSGNVLEWCLSTYVDPGRTSLGGEHSRTLRGGSWNGNLGSASTTSRFRTKPDRWTSFRGFRVCHSA